MAFRQFFVIFFDTPQVAKIVQQVQFWQSWPSGERGFPVLVSKSEKQELEGSSLAPNQNIFCL